MQRPRGHSHLCLVVSLKASETSLLFIGVAPTATEVLGILHHDINVTIPNPPKDNIEDITWKKKGKKIIRRMRGKITKENQEKYQLFENGALEIKHLQRNDSDTYEVYVYNSVGHSVLTKKFDLKILGKSVFPESPPSRYGCYLTSWGREFIKYLPPPAPAWEEPKGKLRHPSCLRGGSVLWEMESMCRNIQLIHHLPAGNCLSLLMGMWG